MLLLPSENLPLDPKDIIEGAKARDSKNIYELEFKVKDNQFLQAVVKRFCDTNRNNGVPNSILLFVCERQTRHIK